MNKKVENYIATLDITIEKEIEIYAEDEISAKEQIEDLMKCRDELERIFKIRLKKYSIKELKCNNE